VTPKRQKDAQMAPRSPSHQIYAVAA
jgi:hypothetical protein